jgi:hypothetical protein
MKYFNLHHELDGHHPQTRIQSSSIQSKISGNHAALGKSEPKIEASASEISVEFFYDGNIVDGIGENGNGIVESVEKFAKEFVENKVLHTIVRLMRKQPTISGASRKILGFATGSL